LPQRWGIWLAIESDLRFLSHHDTARAIERAAIRADLPLRYSQGFNPHPVLSLACPRPVGVTARDDLLVLSLEDPSGTVDAASLVARLNRHAPRGMRFLRAAPLAPGPAPRPRRARYETPIPRERLPDVRKRMEQLAARDTWPSERVTPPRRRSQGTRKRQIDLKRLVTELKRRGGTLVMTLAPEGDLWARPGEVLQLIGLDGRADLAATVRARVDYPPPVTEDMAHNQ